MSHFKDHVFGLGVGIVNSEVVAIELSNGYNVGNFTSVLLLMKVLFILDHFKPYVGGAETLFDNIIQQLNARNIQVLVLTTRHAKSLPKYEKISPMCEVYRVGSNRYNFMWFCFFKGIKLARQVDLIHTTTYNSAIPASIIARIAKKKIVITVHEIFGNLWYRFVGWKGFFYKLFESLIFQFHFDRYRCVSNYTKNSLRISFGISDQRLKTIYLGIDNAVWNREKYSEQESKKIREQLISPGGTYLAMFFGRPGISKGLPFFLLAIPQILKKIPTFKALLILSKDDPRRHQSINDIIQKYDLSSCVTIIPSVPYTQIGTYILASDVVVVPSLAEGFGFAAAEVCALDQNLIVSNTAALPEVVSGHINFVEPSNPREIAEAMIDFHNGKFTTIPKKEFLRENTAVQVLDLYQQLLSKVKN